MNIEAAAAWRENLLAWAAAFVLVMSILLGGGGADGPLMNGLVEALAALLLVFVAARHFAIEPLPRQALGLVWFIAAILLLIALQLIPLPPSVWMGLPGRETATAVSHLIGAPDQWRPLSLDPEYTREHAAALLVPASILFVVVGAKNGGLVILNRSLVLAALLSALLGCVQMAFGSRAGLYFYGHTFDGVPTGVFANPNHQGQLMLAALVATGMMIRLEPPQVRLRFPRRVITLHFAWLLFPIFMVVAISTGSRAVLGLLIPATAAAALIATKHGRSGRLLVAIVAILFSTVAILAFAPNLFAQVRASLTDGRINLIPDALYTVKQYWPWGSGLGTFVPVFQANEDLDYLQPLRVNHAHNDLIELLIETGVAGALLLFAALMGLGVRLFSVIRRFGATGSPWPALTGLVILSLILVHSLVDYPLRTRAIAAVAAYAIGLMFSPVQRRPARSTPDVRRRKGFGGLGAPLPGRASMPRKSRP